MTLTRDEAMHLIDTYCGDEPLDDALERALEHEWEHDPRGGQMNADTQYEVDRVLYGDLLQPDED